jgi:hypothetical protein
MTDTLFRHRMLEKSTHVTADGLYGLPKVPDWLFERTT